MAEQNPTHPGDIIADPARDYRWKRYVLVLVLLAYGVMSIRDGFFRYPRDNEDDRRNGLDIVRHPGYDVQLNQALGVLLPPLAIVFMAWVLYNSRGSYRFDGSTVYVPGHPPVPLNAIRKLDRTKWDRKGIASVDYQIPGTAKAGRFRLDDFIYRREPTDKIFEAIETSLLTGQVAVAGPGFPAVESAAAKSAMPPPPVREAPVGFTPPPSTKPKPRQGPAGPV